MKRLIPILLVWLLCSAFTQGWQKPPLGTQINRSHPWAQMFTGMWIFNEMGGSITTDAVNGVKGKLSGAVTLSNGNANFSATSDGVIIVPANLKLDSIHNNGPLTYIVKFTPTGNTHALIHHNATNSVYYYDVGSGRLYFKVDYDGTDLISAYIATLPLNIPVTVAVTWNGEATAAASVRHYVNGKVGIPTINQNAVGTKLSYSGYNLGNSVVALDSTMSVEYIYMAPTVLPQNVIQEVTLNPYAAFTRSITQRPYMNYGTAGSPAVDEPTKRKPKILMLSDGLDWLRDFFGRRAWAGRE